MEEEDRAPLGSNVVVVPSGDCTEDSRVWGVAEDWSNEDGRQTIGGDHFSHALWHVMSEGRQRGLQSGSYCCRKKGRIAKECPKCRIRVYNGHIHIVPLDNPRVGYFCK